MVQEHKRIGRHVLSPGEEWAVRYPSYLAVERIALLSGKRLSALNDVFFTNARKRCPEMTEPECQVCELDPVCAHRKEFFQPIFRTALY